MAYVFQTFDKRGNPHPNWKFQFTDYTGRRRTSTGTTSKSETHKVATRVEAEHDAIRRGHREPPKSLSKHLSRPFEEVMAEYLAWGNSQGGRGGRPWGKGHARMRKSHLTWWKKELSLDVLSSLQNALSRVERALRELQEGGRAGKTLQNYAESLAALCRWCVQRGYLGDDPLEGLGAFDVTPETKRRALTHDEIHRLLRAAPEIRQVLYEVAMCSGLRANELRPLTAEHLDARRRGIYLDAAWTKNRKPGFQPLSQALMMRLRDLVASGAVLRQYKSAYRRGGAMGSIPKDPLLYVPTHPAKALDTDLSAAGIRKFTPEGKIDFHALRVTFTTLVLESGANVKEAQSLARHATPDLTMNTYGRTRKDSLAGIAEAVGSVVLLPENTIGTQRLAAGAESYCPVTTSVKRDAGSIPAASTISPRRNSIRSLGLQT